MRVVYDASYGFGQQFRVDDAVMTDKTVAFGKYGGTHRKSTQSFCPATPELEKEVEEYMEAREKLWDWGIQIKQKIRAAAIK